MKLLISIISLIAFTFSPIEREIRDTNSEEIIEMRNETLVNQELTFDGYEGEYYFFTDANFQAVVLECVKELPVDLINGNLEGKKFRVSYKAAEQTPDSSCEGVILDVEIADKK